jgi:VIT1/CCC1 family predicted Fe2+/Mn2+ transporter
MHIERIPDGEREEIRQIYRGKGFEGEMLERIVQVITDDRRQWVNTMLTEEWGLQLQPPTPWKAGLATFVAFLLAGMVPLLPTLVWIEQPAGQAFLWSCLLTGFTFFVIGLIRGRVVEHGQWTAGFETLAIGGAAASVAYLVGRLLERLAT